MDSEYQNPHPDPHETSLAPSSGVCNIISKETYSHLSFSLGGGALELLSLHGMGPWKW